jgi:hypothetical protein
MAHDARPEVDTRQSKSSRKHKLIIARKPSAKKWQDELAEVRETYRRVSLLKSGARASKDRPFSAQAGPVPNTSVPTSTDLSRNRARKKAQTDPTFINHARNIQHMYRRIESAYSVTERKKNQYDTTIYPAMLRRPVSACARVGTSSLAEPPSSRSSSQLYCGSLTEESAPRPQTDFREPQVYASRVRVDRPATVGAELNRSVSSTESERTIFRTGRPQSAGTGKGMHLWDGHNRQSSEHQVRYAAGPGGWPVEIKN